MRHIDICPRLTTTLENFQGELRGQRKLALPRTGHIEGFESLISLYQLVQRIYGKSIEHDNQRAKSRRYKHG